MNDLIPILEISSTSEINYLYCVLEYNKENKITDITKWYKNLNNKFYFKNLNDYKKFCSKFIVFNDIINNFLDLKTYRYNDIIYKEIFKRFKFKKQYTNDFEKFNSDFFKNLNLNTEEYKNINRFISIKTETIILNEDLIRLNEDKTIKENFKLYYKLEFLYFSINQSIISYLEQKGYKDIAQQLKEDFKHIKTTNKSYEEQLNEKAKQLLSLDLEEYFKQ